MIRHLKATSTSKRSAVAFLLALGITVMAVSPVSGEETGRPAGGSNTDIDTIVVPTSPGSPEANGKALLMAIRVARFENERAKNQGVTIKLGAGVYDVGDASLRMFPGVHIEGEGVEHTEIVGLGQTFAAPDFSFNRGVVTGADDSRLRNLTVRCENSPELDSCIAMANFRASPIVENVRLIAVDSEGDAHWGMRNNESSPLLKDVEILVANGANNFGLVNDGVGSRPEVRRTTITAMDGTVKNVGILNKLEGLPVRLTSVEIGAMGGSQAIGVMTLPPGEFIAGDQDANLKRDGLKTMKVANSDISAIDAGQSSGFYQGRYLLEMRRSRVLADDSAIDLEFLGDADVSGSELRASEVFARGVNVRIAGSTLLGGGEVLALEAECSGITTENGTQDSCP